MFAEAFLLLFGASETLVGHAFALARRGKTSPDQAPLHPLRAKLLALIRSRPGARLLELWKEMQVHRGSAQYNLEILERVGAVESLTLAGAKHYFPPGFTPLEKRQFALLLRGYVLRVVKEMLDHPGLGQDQLIETLEMNRRVFRLYANLLKGEGLIDEVRRGKARQYYPTPELKHVYDRVIESGHTPKLGREEDPL